MSRIDIELDNILKNNAIKTGMSIPRISNELANYLKQNGWEFTAPQIKMKNLQATQKYDNNYRKRKR